MNRNILKLQRRLFIPVCIVRVCVSKIIPGRVHKCVHGVSFPSRWALASDRRDKERVGKGRTGKKNNKKKNRLIN